MAFTGAGPAGVACSCMAKSRRRSFAVQEGLCEIPAHLTSPRTSEAKIRGLLSHQLALEHVDRRVDPGPAFGGPGRRMSLTDAPIEEGSKPLPAQRIGLALQLDGLGLAE